MPHGVVSEVIPASIDDVFRLLHDYDRRLEWDTLLCEAYLTDGFEQAGLGAVSVCRGRKSLLGITLKTRYVSFRPPHVAAIVMINRPPFFATFAAAIRHQDLGAGSSSVEYKYHFMARPAWLRWLLHPVMDRLFALETRIRLDSLRSFFDRRQSRERG